MTTDLVGRIALVTGGGAGLGAGICRVLAAHGATVAVTDVDADAAKAVAVEVGGRGWALDVRDWQAAATVVGEVEAELGPIRILVGNAGISRRVPFVDATQADWENLLSVNLTGAAGVVRAVLPGMIERRAGRIVTIGSISSKAAYPEFSIYSASKFGVLAMTQAVAAEVARYGITANTVCPGVMDTPLQRGLVHEMVEGGGFATHADAEKWFADMLPLGAPQPVEDVAEMVAYLASDRARHITAASFHVDGGIVPC